MRDFRDSAPSYLTFRITPQDGPLAAFAEQEATAAMKRYPEVMGLGLPQFFPTRECETGGWEILTCGAGTPQGARDSLGSHFRGLAKEAEEAGDEKLRRKWMAAAKRMDREAVDEVRVLGQRFRIARTGRFIRMGQAGPEPPRPSDKDIPDVGIADKLAGDDVGHVIDSYTSTGLSDGLLKVELLSLIGVPSADAPPEMRAESEAAQINYPGGVLLPPVFIISQRQHGRWTTFHPESSYSTPQGARDSLAMYLRVTGPWSLGLDDETKAAWAARADHLDETRADVLLVDDIRYRVTRVERIVRMGPDGPEGSRPSDYDPEPPIDVQVRQLKEEGLWEENDDAPVELPEGVPDIFRMQAMLEAERDRQREWRKARGMRELD
ncbi:PE-PGRS family protein [Streptomyces roseirectus]|uniref:PE-PGRS family protein n=1 Tax=Streptomyces roseirectus TaxID=2768066 RepID=A0A7H0ICZ7_9ACTN|nr:DUF5954 family protein [Streptomyces roseirectus]QNP70663.1 PE-PGRS family protein [Streptomyces roseirectus]